MHGRGRQRCWRRLRKPPYGLEDVPRSWYRRIARYLKELGFVVSLLEPCLFFLWVESTLVCVVVLYVDDLFAGGTREYLNYVIEELQKEKQDVARRWMQVWRCSRPQSPIRPLVRML